MNDIAFHGTLEEETYAGAVRGTKAMRKLMIGCSIAIAVFLLWSLFQAR